jgi:hypothetical protein
MQRVTGRLERFEDAGLVGYRSPALAALGVPHVFTTRHGGRGRELDLGDLGDVNLALLRRGAGAPGARVVHLQQVHGDGVIEACDASDPHSSAEPRADALVGESSEHLLLVRTADCVPVLLARADGRRVAAVHAGWRGLVAGVIPRTLALLGRGPWVAAIGPCLSLARFEVGPEVAQAFERAGLSETVETRPARRPHVDLERAAFLQLARGAVEEIDASGICTWGSQEFFSYRRDVTHGGGPSTGRQGAAIAARAV